MTWEPQGIQTGAHHNNLNTSNMSENGRLKACFKLDSSGRTDKQDHYE